MRKLLLILMAMVPMAMWAQFAPAQDQPGTTAMHADSSAFVAWATGCVAEPGPMNITNPSAGVAGAGWPASNAIGSPQGTMGVTCLGDGGQATLTFASPICNREGPDFAVFENGFANAGNPDLWFLELGFVEVSSDGENFFRFPAISMVQTETQVDGFGCINPAQIHNLASKYGAMYGTPFELDEVPDDPLLDKNSITHVRIVDVVGCIQNGYCTYDSQGNIVNDPWPTPFASCGMDLDAVGVIHDQEHFPGAPDEPPYVANPVDDQIFDEFPQTIEINLDGVVTDPDDPDENITYRIATNSNVDELSATLNGKVLVLTRLSREEGEAIITMRASSNGQSVNFDINVRMNFVPDGIEENQISIAVYPNPTTDFVHVVTCNGASVQMFNAVGQLVLSTEETDINVSELPKGVYFVRVDLNGNIATQRLIIE